MNTIRPTALAVGAWLAGALMLHSAAGAEQKALELTGKTYRLHVAPADGRLLRVVDARSGRTVCRGGDSLWQVEFDDRTRLAAADFSQPGRSCTAAWRETGRSLAIAYGSDKPRFRMTVTIEAEPDGVTLQAEVAETAETVLALWLPDRLSFSSESVRRFHFPRDLGLALKRSWFQPRTAEHPAGWRSRVRGSQMLAKLVGVPCEMGEDSPKPVKVEATPEGLQWLGPELAGQVGRTAFLVNRPPAGRACDAALITSKAGVLLPAYQLGGWGWLLRFGGRTGQRDSTAERRSAQIIGQCVDHVWTQPVQAAAPAQVLGRTRQQAMRGRAKLALLKVHAGAKRGGWAVAAVEDIESALRSCRCVRSRDVQFAAVATPRALAQALQDPDTFAIVNPYGEGLPVDKEGQMDEFLGLIRSFVRRGGLWWEVGGYSFYYELLPQPHASLSGTYPSLFSDFAHLDSDDGRLSVYGIQPESALFVPATLRVGSSSEGGYCGRAFNTYVPPRQSWRSPAVRLAVGRDLVAALADYGRANGFRRGLADKVRADTLAALKQCVLVKYTGGAFEEQTAGLASLPKPTLVHLVDYLRGGFDKQYPDHLPPHPSKGTPEQLRRLYDRAHELGHLVMPYTNPTWWCIEPKGPTFLQHGDVALSLRLDGKLYREQYGQSNRGFRLCTWHPAAQEAQRRVRRQFTRDYPSDVLFQDQVGARGWVYDRNPACPTPYAYTQGLVNLAKEDSQSVPLSTELGHDRLINYETQFCGLTWSLLPARHGPVWRRLYRDMFAPGTWELSPLALWLAHDKVLFTHHDLGQFVRRDETLTWTLAIGYQLIYAISPAVATDPSRSQWLHWLAGVQRIFAARYMGEGLTEFKYLTPTVLYSNFSGTKVYANTGPEPYVLDEQTTIAPRGFYGTADGVEAGILTRYRGRDRGDAGLWFCVERQGKRERLCVYAAPGQRVAWPAPGAVTIRRLAPVPSAPLPATAAGGAVGLEIRARQRDPAAMGPPAELAGPPERWAKRPTRVGLIALEPAGAPRGWTDIAIDQWAGGLAKSRLFTERRLGLVKLRTPGEVIAACRAGVGEWLAIVNPYGEVFPAEGPDAWRNALAAVRDYVRRGGIWWEVAGHPFYRAVWPKRAGGRIVGWGTTGIGGSGWSTFRQSCDHLAVDQPETALRVTELGRQWLGDGLSAQVTGALSVVNRPTSNRGNEFALVASADEGYIAGHHLGGWGILFRACGGGPKPSVLVPIVAATLEHAFTHPRRVQPARGGARWVNEFVLTYPD